MDNTTTLFNEDIHIELRELIDKIFNKLDDYEIDFTIISTHKDVDAIDMKLYIDVLRRKIKEYKSDLERVRRRDDELLYIERGLYKELNKVD